MSFQSLPLELRLQIWAFALPTPRIIELRGVTGKVLISRKPKSSLACLFTREQQEVFTFSHVFARKYPVPALLHLNHESRSFALQHYQLMFDSNPRPSREEYSYLWGEVAPGVYSSKKARNTAVTVTFAIMVGLTPSKPQTQPAFPTRAPIYVSLKRDLILPVDYPADSSLRFDLPRNWIRHEILRRALPVEVLHNIRYLVMPIMPFSTEDKKEMRRYFGTLGGLQGVVVLEWLMWRYYETMDSNRSIWCKVVLDELRLQGRAQAVVRTSINEEALEVEVREGRIWEGGVVKDWD